MMMVPDLVGDLRRRVAELERELEEVTTEWSVLLQELEEIGSRPSPVSGADDEAGVNPSRTPSGASYAPEGFLTRQKDNRMQAKETTIRYGIVRAEGPDESAHYDIVRHAPGQVDEILTRGATYAGATEIVALLNAGVGS
jgi:hypothetical protein